MKKLRLKALSLGAREILSRDQLKSVTGGCAISDDCYGGGYCNPYTNECEYAGSGHYCEAHDVGPCPAPLFYWQRLWQTRIWDESSYQCIDAPGTPPICN